MSPSPQRGIALIGGSGALGAALIPQLLAEGWTMFAVCRGALEYIRKIQRGPLRSYYRQGKLYVDRFDVRDPNTHTRFAKRVYNFRRGGGQFMGFVYMVTPAFKGGFWEDARDDLIGLPMDRLEDAVRTHGIGLVHVYRAIGRFIANQGRIVVVSSALRKDVIQKFLDEYENFFHGRIPSPLNLAHFGAAKAFQDEIIFWLNYHERLIKEKGILVQRIAPAAIDTPFHQSHPAGLPMSLPKISPAYVAQWIRAAWDSDVIVDQTLLTEDDPIALPIPSIKKRSPIADL